MGILYHGHVAAVVMTLGRIKSRNKKSPVAGAPFFEA